MLVYGSQNCFNQEYCLKQEEEISTNWNDRMASNESLLFLEASDSIQTVEQGWSERDKKTGAAQSQENKDRVCFQIWNEQLWN